jgi:hypothetical protein
VLYPGLLHGMGPVKPSQKKKNTVVDYAREENFYYDVTPTANSACFKKTASDQCSTRGRKIVLSLPPVTRCNSTPRESSVANPYNTPP